MSGKARGPAGALLASALLVSALLACFGAPARADVPPALAGRTIVEVRVEGGATEEELREAGLAPGVPLDRRRVRAAIHHLLATGRWADVQIDAEPAPAGAGGVATGGVIVRARLGPRIVVARIELSGNDALSDDDLRSLLRAREGSVLELAELPSMAESIEAVYAERGFVRAQVVIRLRDTDDPARKVLRLELREGEPLRVRGIAWDGAEHAPPSERAFAELGLGEGDVLDRRRLDEGVRTVERRLREHGWLEARVGEPALQPVERGVVVRVPLHLGRHYRVQLEGHAPLEASDVSGVLELADEPLSSPVVSAIHERIVQLYRRHGFHHAEVRVTRTRDPQRVDQPRAALLSIRIVPGTQLQVIGVSFPGASHFGTEFLRDQIDSYLEEDLPSPELFWPVDSEVVDRLGLSGRRTPARREVPADVEVVPARVWYESTYADAAAHIQELYEAAGFLRARVGTPELRELEDDLAVVVVPVFEGPRTLVYDVRVRGNEVVGARALLDAAGLSRGDPFGYLPLEQARRRVRDLYAERGHLFARVDPQVRFSPDGQRAEIVLEIVERFPVEVGEIRIEGAERTDVGLIRDVVTLRAGQVYRPSAARESAERLRSLGVFASVNVAPADPDLAERVKPVIVTVTERDPQVVGLSAGFATGEGARGTFEYSYRNLFGLALTLTFRVQLAYQLYIFDDEVESSLKGLDAIDRLERRITLGLGVPWLPGLPNVRAALDLAHIRDNERDFGYDKNGATLSFTWVPERIFALTLSGEVEHNGVQLFSDQQSLQDLIQEAIMRGDVRAQRLLRVPAGNTAIGSTRVSSSLDLRDNPFTPSSGIYLAAGAELVHSIASEQLPPQPGGEPQDPFFSNFTKLTASVTGYVPLATGWVLAMQGRFGAIAHLESGSQTYPNRAFYLGGVDTLRGFLQDQVIPEDQARLIRETGLNPAEITRTGDLFYLFRAELRFPIVDALQGGVFADVGNVWALVANIDRFAVRWSAGLGLRIATPVGPIALDYGFNLDRREDLGEPFGSLHFSIGLF